MSKLINENSNLDRILKVVFTLKSGKSIVSSLKEAECFRIYNQWITYIPGIDAKKDSKKDEKKDDGSYDKIIIQKKSDNVLVEVTAILVSDIVAIQIDDTNKFNK